jgi:hypothetical protein
MSDYLDNLVARSCDLIEVAQPRPISIFEPPPETTWSPSDRPLTLETAEGESALGERPPDALEITRLAARHSPAAPHATGAGVEQEPPGVSPAYPDVHVGPRGPQPEPGLAQVASTRIAESVPQRPSEGRPGTTPDSIAAAGSDVPHEAVEGAIRLAVEPAVERTVIERIVPLATPPPMPTVSPTSQAAPLLKVTGPEGYAIKATLARPDPTHPAPVIARPHERPYLEPAPPPTTPSMAKPAPTIQVTIGRLEVRATPPPTPPSKQRSTPPAMSLDDYMRQRNGGRR